MNKRKALDQLRQDFNRHFSFAKNQVGMELYNGDEGWEWIAKAGTFRGYGKRASVAIATLRVRLTEEVMKRECACEVRVFDWNGIRQTEGSGVTKVLEAADKAGVWKTEANSCWINLHSLEIDFRDLRNGEEGWMRLTRVKP